MDILIVDDDKDARLITVKMLVSEGYLVREAGHGQQALETLAHGGVGLIVSDILMPVMDGFQLCHTVKTDETLRHIPFIFLTATYTGAKDEEFALKIGADRFITKPCETGVLLAAIAGALKEVTRPPAMSKEKIMAEDEVTVLKLYNERLIRKLEEKTLHLEQEIRRREGIESQLKESHRQLAVANKIIHIFLTVSDDEMYARVLDVILESTQSQYGIFGYINEVGQFVCPSMTREIWDKCQVPDKSIVFPHEAWRKFWAMSNGGQNEKSSLSNSPIEVPEGHVAISRAIDIPLRYSGQLIGTIIAANKPTDYTGSDRELLEAIGDQIAPVLHARLQRDREEARKNQAEATLRSNLSLLQNLIDTIPNPIFYKDAQGRYMGGNRSWSQTIIGLPLNEIVGRTMHQFPEQVPPELAARYHEQDMALIRKSGLQNYEASVRTADGKLRDYIFNKATFCNSDGKTAGLVGCMLDITDRKQAEQQRLKLEARLQQAQKLEAIGALAGGIAHDFNNILSAVIGFAELAREQLTKESPGFEDIGEVLAAGHRARKLVGQILAFSRQSRNERIPMELHLVVKEVLTMLRSTLPTTIEIHQNTVPTGMILGDPTQIHQVVMNLCTNAFHAMRETGGHLYLEVKRVTIDGKTRDLCPELAPGPYVQMSVRDTGCGIPPDILGQIFDPYFTTKPEGEGTGLGLSVVHGIVREHEGGLAVHSEPGKGTVFHVFLPQIDSKIGDQKDSDLFSVPGGNERILFVDDEPVLVELGQKMLQRLGYRVYGRTRGEEALALFRASAEPFDLVITDMTMPNMTGAELARELLRLKPDLPIILCTGFSYTISEDRARMMGIQGFAMKPFVRKDLASLIRRLLDQKPTP